MFVALLTLVLVGADGTAGYPEVYAAHKRDCSPLVFVVTADNCPPCEQLKKAHLPRLRTCGHVLVLKYPDDVGLISQVSPGTLVPRVSVWRRVTGQPLPYTMSTYVGLNNIVNFMQRAAARR
jgi:hypothetical protein